MLMCACRSVPVDEIIDHLSCQNVAIVLVDCNKLHCLRCHNIQTAIGVTATFSICLLYGSCFVYCVFYWLTSMLVYEAFKLPYCYIPSHNIFSFSIVLLARLNLIKCCKFEPVVICSSYWAILCFYLCLACHT